MKSKLFLSAFLFVTANCLFPTFSFAQTIAGGGSHSLAVCNDATVRAWGRNALGQLGNGNNADSNVPVQVSAISGVISIVAGWNYSCILKNDGTVWAWGYNGNGQLGNGAITNSNVPQQVNVLTGVTSISAQGGSHTLALKNDGTVWAWGSNGSGQLGNGTTTDSKVPIQVNGLSNMIAIAGGLHHSLALKNDGTVWAWGWNAYGQLGTGNGVASNVPVMVSFLTGITSITTGGWYYSLALKNDGTVWAWGNNEFGQLGNGTNTISYVPVLVSSLTDITAIAATSGSEGNSLALKNNGTVWAWGNNFYGQLGSGNNTNSNVPVQTSNLSGVIAIAGGGQHSLALKNNGTLWVWGDNSDGQLGTGNNTDSNVPIQVSGLCYINGIDELQQQENVSVYPNPTNGKFTIQVVDEKWFTAKGNIEFFSVLGEKIYQSTNSLIQKLTMLDISSQPSGVYFLKIINPDGSSALKKIIKE